MRKDILYGVTHQELKKSVMNMFLGRREDGSSWHLRAVTHEERRLLSVDNIHRAVASTFGNSPAQRLRRNLTRKKIQKVVLELLEEGVIERQEALETALGSEQTHLTMYRLSKDYYVL